MIDYSLPGVPGAQERYRLIPTLPDPKKAPALELAALYHERREVKGVFDKLQTHLAQRRRTLRSKTPNGVRQAFHGWVSFLAEAVRFELTNGCPLPVFKTGAIDHSATLPEWMLKGPPSSKGFKQTMRCLTTTFCTGLGLLGKNQGPQCK